MKTTTNDSQERTTRLRQWIASQGLPTRTISGPMIAERLLASPDSLTGAQREWLAAFLAEVQS